MIAIAWDCVDYCDDAGTIGRLAGEGWMGIGEWGELDGGDFYAGVWRTG